MGADRDAYIARCFQEQERFLNGATAELTRAETFGIFADIAEDVSGGKVRRVDIVQIAMTRKPVDYYMKAWAETKVGLAQGVMGSPRHTVDGVLVSGTDSEWGVAEYRAKLATLPLPLRKKTALAALALAAEATATIAAKRSVR